MRTRVRFAAWMVGWLIGAAMLLAPAAVCEPRLALVIGNGAYAGGAWGPLKNPANDARLMEKSLRQVGFQVTTLIDADLPTMEAAIKSFGIALNEAGPDAVALFYYSGHGAQVDGRNWLAPVSSRARTQQDLFRDALRLGYVEEWMTNGGAHINFIILDACRNNSLPATTRAASSGLAPPQSRSPMFLYAYSTAPGATASDGAGDGSPYTQALAEAILTPGLPAELAFKRVAQRMSAIGQSPFYETAMVEDFCFRGCDGARAPSPVAEPVASPPARLAPAPSSANGSVVADFARVNTNFPPDYEIAAAPILHAAGIPIDIGRVYPDGSRVVLKNNLGLYGGQAIAPTVSQNFLTQVNIGQADCYFELRFAKPVAAVTFMIPGIYPATSSGVTFPAWRATAYSAGGDELSTVSEALARRMADSPSRTYTLRTPNFDGIASVRFASDFRLDGVPFAAFAAVLVERLELEPMR